MGTKIGDYVHLHLKNYRAEGTNTSKDKSNYHEWDNLVNGHDNIIISSNENQIAGLENFLNSLIYGEEKSQEDIDREIFQKKIQPKVIELFNKMYPGLSLGQYYGVYKIPKETTKEGLAKNADTYIKLITNIMNKNTGLNSSDLQSLSKVKDRLEKLKNGETIKHNKLINELNAIIAEEKFSLSAVGDGFEIALGVISEVLNGKAVDTIDKLTKEVWTGQERSSVRIDATKFQQGLLDEMQASLQKAGHHTLPLDDGTITYNVTQDKADINFTWHGSDLHLSAKNYSLSSNPYIHLLSGTSMFTLLSLESVEYVNHYLNIMGTRDTSRMVEARDDFKRLILLRALTGQGTGKNNVADTFIVNIRSKKKIKLLTMSRIYNAYKKDLKNVEIKNFNNGFVVNNEAATPKQRIGAMLADLHSRKLAVSINASKIDKI